MTSPTPHSFSKKVYEVVANIPKGEVLTYKQVAAAAGSPKAYRAVGTLMAKNYNSAVPCHRVVKSDGTLGNYNRGGPKKKFELLHREGYRG